MDGLGNLLIVFAFVAVISVSDVHAETCPYIAQQRAIKEAADQQFEVFEKTQDCSMIPSLMAAVRQNNALTEQIVRNCPGAAVQRANSDPATLESALRAHCKAGGTASQRDNSCVKPALRSDVHCDHNDSVTMEAVNSCDGPRRVRICLERRGGALDCDGWQQVPKGSSTSYWTCAGTGRYSLEVQ
jgi:hypothetical protein